MSEAATWRLRTWWSLHQCAEFLQHDYGLSIRQTERSLAAAGASVEVRTRVRQWDKLQGNGPAISRHRWIGAEVNIALGEVTPANGIPTANVEFYAEDLREWATRNLSITEPAKTIRPSPAGFQTNRQALKLQQCVEWIRKLPVRPARTKAVVRAEALAAIPGLSGRQFNNAWDQAADASWQIPGPK